MKKHLSFFAILLAAGVAACSSATTSASLESDFATLNGARVEIVAEGGLAALSVRHLVIHDSRAFVYVQRRLCTTNCPAPMDSTGGTLSAAVSDSLFNLVLEQNRLVSKDDFGLTANAADMMNYTIRITTTSGTRTIKGDDGSLPEPARRIVDAVRAIVSAARK